MKKILKYPIVELQIALSLIAIMFLAILNPTFVKKGLLFLVNKWEKMTKPKKSK